MHRSDYVPQCAVVEHQRDHSPVEEGEWFCFNGLPRFNGMNPFCSGREHHNRHCLCVRLLRPWRRAQVCRHLARAVESGKWTDVTWGIAGRTMAKLRQKVTSYSTVLCSQVPCMVECVSPHISEHEVLFRAYHTVENLPGTLSFSVDCPAFLARKVNCSSA